MDTDYLKDQIEELNKRITEVQELLGDNDFAALAEQEIKDLEQQKQELEESASTSMEESSAFAEASADKDESINPNVANLEIRAAAGGDEAGIFAGDLLRMYSRFALNQGWKMEDIDRSEGGLGQIKTVLVQIRGKGSY